MSTPTQQVFSEAVMEALKAHPRFTTINDLAVATGYHRNSVSRAINQGRYPKVQKKIRSILKLKFAL